MPQTALPRAARPAAISRLRSQAGFTMVEVLVAMLLLLVGMLATFLLVGNANATLSKTRAREAATNLAREVLEDARDTPYSGIGKSNWFQSNLQGISGGSGVVTASGSSGAQTTVTRRGVAYSIVVSWCSVDDNGDGYGSHSTSVAWCSDSATTATADPQPEDFKRVTATINWSFASKAQPTLVQTATFAATGAATGPTSTNLVITSPSGLSSTTPVITSNPAGGIVTFLGTSVGAADMKFFVDSTEQLGGTTNNNNGTWSFNWNITAIPDGVYTINAVAVDALGNRGPPRALQVKLARGAPAPPANVTGGYNYVYVSGNKTLAAEFAWDANIEGDVTGYQVNKGATVVCSASLKVECLDLSPASSGSTTYTIKTLYTDAAGNPNSVSTDYAVTAPVAPVPSYVGNIGQSNVSSCGLSGGSTTVTVPAGTTAAVGNRVLVRVALRRSGSGAVAVSDSKGNSYAANADVWNSSQDQRVVVFSAHVTSALVAGNTITVTFPPNPPNITSSVGVVADVLGNVATTSPVDATGTGTGNTNTASATTSSATTIANDLLIGASSSQPSNQTATTPAGWTGLTGQTIGCGGGSNGNSVNTGHYRIVSSTGTYTWTSTLNNSSVGWAAAIVAYKPGTAGGLAVPGTPTGFSAAAGANGTTVLSWTAPTGTPAPDFYRIYRDGVNYTNRVDTAPDNGTSTVTWTDASTGGTSHTYRVTAVSAFLAESAFAGPVTQ
jgi:prepilin-type N-terminal cleavage/methylation domain-containing protein